MSQDDRLYRQRAAEQAVEFVAHGMVVGLGHGRTALFAVRRIADLIKDGRLKDILCVPCSVHVESEAKRLGIPLTTLEEHPVIDVTIDGADEVDRNLDLIKGAGGALLREKIVAQASRREIIVVDESKLSPALGTRRTLPVEIVSFGWRTQIEYLASIGARVHVRQANDGSFFKTDEDNLIIDCAFGPIVDPTSLGAQLSGRAGIVAHGLFLGLATDVIVAGVQGVRHLRRQR